MTLAFDVNERDDGYRIDGTVRSSGVADFFSRFVLRTESIGLVSGTSLLPRTYKSDSASRRRRRSARVTFGSDGAVEATVDPPEDPGHVSPTEHELRGSYDPLSGILQFGHVVARHGTCAARIPVFDGRRRYDLVFADGREMRDLAGSGKLHCAIEVIKLAGFSAVGEPDTRVDHAEVWLGVPRPGAPFLPERVEFAGSWGPIRVSLDALQPGH
jgi:hypothetical protein